jgi:NAD dependent epimerase/dehydratase
MKVLVTGAGGFIGSHLTEMLVEKGYNVKAFLHYNSLNKWGWLEKSKYIKDIEIVRGDIRDFDSVNNAIKGTETVFHLAALIGIPYSYLSPLAYIKTNIEGTYNVLYSSLLNNISKVIITSTSEVYGTAQYVPINENHPLVGQSPYSASKIGGDQMAISFYRSFGLPVIIARPFNTYGPRQSARAIIPTIVSQILSGSEHIKIGNLSPTRDLTYVKDTIDGFLEIYKSVNLLGEVFNIGMYFEISVRDLIKKISNISGINIDVEIENERVRPENSEVERLLCDNSKLIKKTRWRPKYNIESGLKETIEWIKDNLAFYKSEIYNV